MKKSLSFLLLFLALNLSVWATNITVQTASVPNFRVNGIGTNRTGTVTATNGDDDVTCSACLPSNLVGLGGYQILLGATTYYVSSTTSTSAFTLTTNFAGVTGSTSFTLYPTILFRIYSSMDWLPLGSASIIQQGAPGSDNFHQEYAVSVISNTVYLPSLVLSATTDPAVNLHKNARYGAWFHRMDGARIQVYGGFNSFAVPTTTPTTWAALLTYNTPNISRPIDSSTLSSAQIEALIAAGSTVSGTANTIGKIGGGGAAIVDSNLTQDVSGNLTAGANLAVAGAQTVGGNTTLGGTLGVTGNATISGVTDTAGGIPNKTAAQIAALTIGATGRTFYQTDGLKGWYRDYGASVGIRHAQPYYDAYERGFIPNDSSNGVRVINSGIWTALQAALPSTGARFVFPEGTFYFASELSTAKPLIIEGAGTAAVSGGTPFGTVIVVESGENGFEFLSGATGSVLRNLTVKTRSGYSGVSTGDGVYSAVPVRLENLNIESFGRDGVFLNGTTANTDLSSLRGIHSWGNKRDNYHFDGGADTNAIYVENCNSTLAGRHGFYNAGASNIFISSHAAYSAQVTVGGHDYHEAGASNVWILPYAETTGSEQFYFDTGSNYCTVICGSFGVPTFTNTAPGFYGGHNIIERGYYRDLRLRDTGDSVGGHDYTLASRNIDEGGQIRLYDATASAAVLDYRPSTTQLIVPSLSYRGILKATGTPQTATGGGSPVVINLTTDATLVVTSGSQSFTLAAGAEGQYKTIKFKTDGGDATISVTNLLGGTTITMNDAGDFVYLRYLDGQWIILQNSGCTVS